MPELNGTILLNNANLKAYYRFESGALTTDSGGNGKTLTNNGTATENASGQFGGAVTLNGSSQTLSIADALVSGTTNSISLWFKPANLTQMGMMFYIGNATTSGYGVGLSNGTNGNGGDKLTLLLHGVGWYHTGVAVPNTTSWHHLVLIRVASMWRIYLNGKHVYSASVAPAAPASLFTVGKDGSSGSYYFNGSIDDVAVFDTALSADQIKELYEGRIYGELFPGQFGTTVGLWHLNGNSTDFSGNNNHGTDTAITYSAANGKWVQGADFNGTDGRIQVTDSASLSITGNYTLSCWVNIDILPGNNVTFDLLNKYDVLSGGSSNTGYDLYLVNDSGTHKIILIHGKGAGSVSVTVNNTLSIGEWTHLVGVYNGSTMKLYKNGVEIGTANVSDNPLDNAKSLNFGNFGYYTPTLGDIGRYLNGKMDEIFICSTALTANQISQLYAYQKGLLGRYV